ncbi:hypothetical protein ACWEO2_31635 [Nocardia sp. NPDC004278]
MRLPFPDNPSPIHASTAPGSRSRRANRHEGIFEAAEPLRLLPFELRYLGRITKRGGHTIRTGPDRWVIDLSAHDGKLLPPHRYIDIPLPEDRLFVPAEYLALFTEKGWGKA